MSEPKISFEDYYRPILGRAANAYFYARDVVGGRWPDGEDMIMDSPTDVVHYAKDVMKGRLPDAMHNEVVLRWGQDPALKETALKYLKMVSMIEEGHSVRHSWDQAFSMGKRPNKRPRGTRKRP